MDRKTWSNTRREAKGPKVWTKGILPAAERPAAPDADAAGEIGVQRDDIGILPREFGQGFHVGIAHGHGVLYALVGQSNAHFATSA
jgi:hypothetical protein